MLTALVTNSLDTLLRFCLISPQDAKKKLHILSGIKLQAKETTAIVNGLIFSH